MSYERDTQSQFTVPVEFGNRIAGEFLDLGNLSAAIGRIFKAIPSQGVTPLELLDSQFLCVAEEGGEAAGAYRRWRGFARRPGSPEAVEDELADCVISAMVAMLMFNQAGRIIARPEDVIARVLAAKITKIVERGFINKHEDVEIAQEHLLKIDVPCDQASIIRAQKIALRKLGCSHDLSAYPSPQSLDSHEADHQNSLFG